MKKAGYDPDFNIGLCDYDGTRDPKDLLANDYNKVYYALRNSFYAYRNSGIECTRADLVCHSMGGLMARKYLEDYTHSGNDGHNKSLTSYSQGMVRRVVTVATPHRGSPFAEDLISNAKSNQTRDAINSVLNYAAGLDLDANADSAYRDLLPCAQTYGFPKTVPMHSIYGDISNGMWVQGMLLSLNLL